MRFSEHRGFTLAELLIALAILGVIATFTIPKVLNGQKNVQNMAIAKEMVAAISEAYQAYKIENTVDASTRQSVLIPYFNYVSISTVYIDASCTLPPASGSCGIAGITCLKFHNGAVIRITDNQSFSDTTALNAYRFHVDVDGAFNGERSFNPFLFFNGRITTTESLEASVTNSTSTYNPSNSCHPDWFSWS